MAKDAASCPPTNENFVPNKRAKGVGLEELEQLEDVRQGSATGKSKPHLLTIPDGMVGCTIRDDWLQMERSLDKECNLQNECFTDAHLPSCCSCDNLLSIELDQRLSPDMAGRCVLCYMEQPTLMAWPCGHVPYCEMCAKQTQRRADGGSGGGDGGPDVAFNPFQCPLCRQDAQFHRIYLPEDTGSPDGLCFRCRESKAEVVVLGCNHLSLCVACVGSELQVKCPVCNTFGQAFKIFG